MPLTSASWPTALGSAQGSVSPSTPASIEPHLRPQGRPLDSSKAGESVMACEEQANDASPVTTAMTRSVGIAVRRAESTLGRGCWPSKTGRTGWELSNGNLSFGV